AVARVQMTSRSLPPAERGNRATRRSWRRSESSFETADFRLKIEKPLAVNLRSEIRCPKSRGGFGVWAGREPYLPRYSLALEPGEGPPTPGAPSPPRLPPPPRPAHAPLPIRLIRLAIFLLPCTLLCVCAVRSPDGLNVILWLGAGFQFLGCALALFSRRG